MIFADRAEAGIQLADKLLKEKFNDPIVLGIPRGGVVTAAVVAKKLKAPLDLIITRKIGYPGNPEFAAAAVDPDGVLTENPEIPVMDREYLETESKAQTQEIERRYRAYRPQGKPTPDLTGRDVIAVDDGIATGLTTIAAVRYLKKKGAKKVILAVPVIPADNIKKLEAEVDKLVYIEAPKMFFAVGQFYADFPQTTDEEVLQLMS